MISNLRLQNFRSYADATYEFGQGVNIIVGANTSGKTNLLEAVLVLCQGASFRAADKELIRHDQEWCRLSGQAEEIERVVKMQHLVSGSTKKEYKIGGSTYSRLPHGKTLPVVVFEPNHLQLLTESPELRRGFLDDVIEKTKPSYGNIRRQYRRALAQRNRLLKNDFPLDQIFVWNVRLSELGGQVAEERRRFTEENTQTLSKIYNTLATRKTKVEFEYDTKIKSSNYGSSLLKELEARTQTDKERGFTTIGPHRDDIRLAIDGYPLAEAASRGETRTMLLALKLLEVQSVERAREHKPILLLDDVFSELDGARRRALTEHLRDYQTFITTTDADIVVQHFLDDCTVLPLG